MLNSETTGFESSARLRRPTAAPGVVFAMASPPTPRSDLSWPSWLAPVGASWKRPSAFRSTPESRSE